MVFKKEVIFNILHQKKYICLGFSAVLYLVILIFFTHAYTLGWNDRSRMATLDSLVNHNTFSIDHSKYIETGDKYFFDGHFFSDKPPIYSLLTYPFYLAVVKTHSFFKLSSKNMLYPFTLIISILTNILGMIYFYKILSQLSKAKNWNRFLTFLTFSGTLFLSYATVINVHILSGVLLLISTYYILKTDEKKPNMVISALSLSIACSIDIGMFIFIPFTFLYIILGQGLKTKSIIQYCISLFPFILLYFFFNKYLSGSFIPPQMNTSLWNYPNSYFSSSNLSGLVSHNSVIDFLVYFFHMIIGKVGIFSLTPHLLFIFLGFYNVYKKQSSNTKNFALYILISTTAYIFIYSIKTTNYSGGSFGVRWFVATIPFLSILICFANHQFIKTFILLSSISIIISFLGMLNPYLAWNISPLHEAIPLFSTKDSSYIIKVSGLCFATIILMMWNYRLTFSKK